MEENTASPAVDDGGKGNLNIQTGFDFMADIVEIPFELCGIAWLLDIRNRMERREISERIRYILMMSLMHILMVIC